ncbi:hypothetical protein [Mesorhizobium sp. M0768]|uniref:hypothetical protein n=1 Tax=Mesorhizobium sp. M0768 TaxID=2956996 RepID=UPI00333C137D
MKSITVTAAEQPEIYAMMRRERPAIHRSVIKMAKQMRGLSDVSQKQAIAELTATWILAIYPGQLGAGIIAFRRDARTDRYLSAGKQKEARSTALMHAQPRALAG